MTNQKTKRGIIIRIVALVATIIAIFAGGYFCLDKVIVPKYFGNYGINNVPDLVGVVTSLYKSPNESKFITNGHTKTDLSNAIEKLQSAGYKIDEQGVITEENMHTLLKINDGDNYVRVYNTTN